MLSASLSFPNRKDMDSFIQAWVSAKATITPLSQAMVGGNGDAAAAAAAAGGGGGSAAGVGGDAGIMTHVLMAGARAACT